MFGNIYLSLQEIRANITLVAFLDVAVNIVLLAEHLLTNLTLMRVLCRTGFLGLLWIGGQQWLYLFPLSKLSQSSWNEFKSFFLHHWFGRGDGRRCQMYRLFLCNPFGRGHGRRCHLYRLFLQQQLFIYLLWFLTFPRQTCCISRGGVLIATGFAFN